ncbi:MAG TPA: PRTRC system protein E [Terracidiphilus sp.]|jgi:PRTRC genetic system protein E|nr:PRTRC system protein E [Terracidiphilus sp.]
MFKELAPVLRHRAVLMTITFAEDDQIRVNVVPKKLKDDENKALTTPLTITGTAEELDAELGPTLVDFVAAHLQLKNTLKQAKEEMDDAAKAAQAEARSKSKTPVKKDATSSTSATAKPAQIAKATAEPAPPPPPRTASLFDMPTVSPAPSAPAAAPVETVAADEDEDEILSEIKEDGTDDDEVLGEAA